ncbi:MAG TPA: glycosyltransferase [Streptosporangiaceae bacterium]|nr:glycosyltransferase [Streptosporangiaceae bacterium]
MPVLVVACVLAAVAWVYLLAAHGGYWRTGCRLPVGGGGAEPDPAKWPSVVVVIPARDEADLLPETLPSLLAQKYPGELSVVLVDDGSSDGTAEVAESLGSASAVALKVIPGGPVPTGWAGKVWAMAQGVAAAGDCDYLLFTDADIAFEPGTVGALVRAAVTDDRALLSQMALLRADTGWERWIVPAFVYFFAQLYPFRRAGRPRARTAAAAGGCMLVCRPVLAAAGGLDRIRDARIDDIALARLLKRPPVAARCWLGFTTDVRSRRPYPRLAELWGMVSRSAYTQLRYSPALLAAALAGLAWLYLLPPVAALGGLAALAAGASGGAGASSGAGASAGAGAAAAWCAAAGLAGWALQAVSYVPVLRMYRLSWLRALGLPLVALLYAGMTADSARLHHAGRGGAWKGRTIPL